MALTSRLAGDPKRYVRKTLVCTVTDFHAHNVATLNLVIDGSILTSQIHDFSIFLDFKFDRSCTIFQVSCRAFTFINAVFSIG